MAYCDYLHCEVCDKKTIYDANVDYESANYSDIKVLCEDCGEKYQILIIEKEN
ncbi:MAG: hypothetical protein GWN01_16435 [Nitrosopumilaceae archaeon]|nr:hypothetical protein [Nitrosopumilaceae archaeon]NIV66990.1 hypothetical protein [Nitrosopumilaceae archaeon]NIX63025.1 hypothetical protein [Nitrosopumilaceae archaeon]